MVSDVDICSCGERRPLKGLRRVTTLPVSALLLLLQTGPTQEIQIEMTRLIGLRRLSNVKRLSNSRHVFFKKKEKKEEIPAEGKA